MRGRLLLGLLLAALAGCDSGTDHEPPPPPGPRVAVTVDVDQTVATRGSMNGFIHSLSATEPGDDLVRPLSPRLWRSDLSRAPLDRALALGARYQLVLSDLWGYPSNDWNGRGPPWADLAAWERFVRQVAREHEGQPISWDIWNEPDGPTFWSGGRERFFRTYAVANRVLREELGDGVEIAGPSVSRYSPRWIDAFLDHCVAARCRISALAWHENLRPDDPLEGIAPHLSDARTRVLADPRYASLGMREIHVNEYVGAVDRYLPGEAVAYLSQLEAGGADLAALSCWTEEDCAPSGLDGLLTPADGAPRAVWWAHRWYAQGSGARVRSESSDAAVAVLASARAEGRVEVLLGHVAPRPGGETVPRVSIEVALAGLPMSGGVRATIDRLPAAGDDAVRPERLADLEVTVEEGAARLAVPALGIHEAALVSLGPSGN